MNRLLPIISVTAALSACTNDYDLGQTKDYNLGADTAMADTASPIVDDGATGNNSGKPVAVCDVAPNPVHPPFESATWTGVGSYDPEGVSVTEYEWSLISAPDGSSITMPGGSGPVRSGFTPDQAGEYIGQLIVQTGDGRRSEPCTVELEAEPAENLWVEMFWVHSGDDMDLHLLAPGGSVGGSGDCHWMNTNPDWGVPGETADDPSLDIDDISDIGPENINIAAPENGVYRVMVHDYPGSSYSADNPVTVNVYIDGSLQWTDTRVISGEDSETYFASIDWATRTVTAD